MSEIDEKRDQADKAPRVRKVSTARLWWLIAWDTWLRGILALLPAILLAVAWVAGWIPDHLMGRIVCVAVLLAPLVFILFRMLSSGFSKMRLTLGLMLLAALGAAGAWPLVSAYYPHLALDHEFSFSGKPVVVEPQLHFGEGWIAEVRAKLPQTEKPSQVRYDFEIRSQKERSLIQGELRRDWEKMRAGLQQIGRKLEDRDRRIHHLDFRLDRGAEVVMRHKAGKTDGPIRLTIRASAADWGFMLWFGLPLLLLAAAMETTDPLGRRKTFLTGLASFILAFGYVSANNLIADSWFGAVALGLLAGVGAAFILGFIIVRIVRPFSWRIFIKRD